MVVKNHSQSRSEVRQFVLSTTTLPLLTSIFSLSAAIVYFLTKFGTDVGAAFR
jgi:hypothetical protein